jgi:hypothetical protein
VANSAAFPSIDSLWHCSTAAATVYRRTVRTTDIEPQSLSQLRPFVREQFDRTAFCFPMDNAVRMYRIESDPMILAKPLNSPPIELSHSGSAYTYSPFDAPR